jgi:hypothetical protein
MELAQIFDATDAELHEELDRIAERMAVLAEEAPERATCVSRGTRCASPGQRWL